MASSNDIKNKKNPSIYNKSFEKVGKNTDSASENSHLSLDSLSLNYGTTNNQNENTSTNEEGNQNRKTKSNELFKSIHSYSDEEDSDIFPEINNVTFDKSEVQPYCFLVISALYHLYYENETDKSFMTQFLNDFGKEKKLKVKEKDILEMMMMKGEFGIDPIEMHISAVKKTIIFQKFGAEIFIHDLIFNSIKKGTYDSRAKTLTKYLAYELIVEEEKALNMNDDNNNNNNDDDKKETDEGSVDDDVVSDDDSGCHDTDASNSVYQDAEEIKVNDDDVTLNNSSDETSHEDIINNDTVSEWSSENVSEGNINKKNNKKTNKIIKDLDNGTMSNNICLLSPHDNEIIHAGSVVATANQDLNIGDDEASKSFETSNEIKECDKKEEIKEDQILKNTAECHKDNNSTNVSNDVGCSNTADGTIKNNNTGNVKSIENQCNKTDENGDDKDKGKGARKRHVHKYMLQSRGMVEKMEDRLQIKFLNMAYEQTKKEKDEQIKRDSQRKLKKIALIGLVSIGGGVLIGLTAGLAAPLVAGGLGLTAGAVGSVLFATKAGLAVVGSLFGLAGAGLTGHKMNKRVGDLEEFEFEELTEGRSLTVTLAITGWLNEKYTGFRKVWLGLDNSAEQYVLVYESKQMRELGDSLKRITDIGISIAMSHSLGYTALSGLVQAMMWPMALLNVAEVIDNPWNVCTKRSSLAGEHLADVLLAREQGNRPVCLIGFGVGARVIFSCLQEMARRENCQGIVEEVIMLGAPVTADPEQWKKLQNVVSGRIVNGYSRSDWLLKFIFRTASAQLRVAGLQPIEWQHRIMHNLNLEDIVCNHFDYMEKIDEILSLACVKSKERVPVKGMSSLAQWTTLKQQQGARSKGDTKKNHNQAAIA